MCNTQVKKNISADLLCHILLIPLTGDVNNIDHLITLRCSAGKPWVLAFMFTLSTQPNTVVDQLHLPYHNNHKGNLHNFRLVVIILCLIDVYVERLVTFVNACSACKIIFFSCATILVYR